MKKDNPRAKLMVFLLNPCEENLLTLEEYESLEPFDKGYANYLQSAWEKSQIPTDINPFEEGTTEFIDFRDGGFCAMQEVQETEG